MEDFSRELVDVVPSAEELLFDIVIHGGNMTLEELRRIIKKWVSDDAIVDIVIDVFILDGVPGSKESDWRNVHLGLRIPKAVHARIARRPRQKFHRISSGTDIDKGHTDGTLGREGANDGELST